MNKIILLLVITLLLLNPVIAKTIEETIYKGNSLEVPGYNITLMGIGIKEKSIVACINNEIYIIDKGNRKQLENLKIEPTRIYEDYIKLKITYSCEDCICNESCSNNLCFNTSPEQKEEITQETIEEIIQEQEVQEQTQQKNSTTTFSIILFFIVLILLIILLIKKR